MGTPYIALYPSDYLADTAHLGLTEHGIYWRMLLHYYQHCKPFPNDLEKINRVILAATPEEKRVTEYILAEYFVLTRDEDGEQRWHHSRADKEIAAAATRVTESALSSKMGAIGGKKSAETRRLRYGTAQPLKPRAEPPFEPPFEPHFEKGFEAKIEGVPKQPEPEPEEDKRKEAKASLSGKPDDARQVIDHLNAVSGRKFREVDATLKLIRARLKEYDLDTLKAVVDQQWREWHGTEWEKYMAPDTLFNATKCAKYVGQLGASTEDDWRKEVMWSQT